MTVGGYAVGFAALLVVCASMTVTAVSLRTRLLAGWSGAPARLAEFVIGLSALIGILEVLGAVGLFRLGPILVAAVLVAVAARAWSRRGRASRASDAVPGASRASDAVPAASRAPGRAPAAAPAANAGLASSPLMLAVALAAAGAVIAEWAVPTLISYDVGIRSLDSLWYHLPWAASFAQTGWVTSLRFTDVEYLTAFYPATAELVHGVGIVLLGRDVLSPAINLGWLSLTLLAAWCIGSPRGLGPVTMTGAALALATPMLRISQGGTAANDIAGVFFLLAAVALVVNAREPGAACREPGARREPGAARGDPGAARGDPGAARGDPDTARSSRVPLVIAAISAGLAVAVKLSLLAPVLALTVGTIATAGRGRRRRAASVWIGALVLASGYWYVRNLVAVGNPLPWAGLGILPTPAAPLQQNTGFSIVHYATDTGLWSHIFAPGFASGLGPWWVAILAVAVLGPLICVLGSSRPTTQMLGLVALASLGAYLITPETAAGPAGDPTGFAFNLRYAAPGLTLALTVTPLAPWLDRARARAATCAVLVILLVVTLAEGRLWNSGYVVGAIVVGVSALIALAALIGLARRPPARGIMIAGTVAALAAVAVAGYAGERHYLRGRYTFVPGQSSLSTLWAWARGIHHARIGLVGTFGGFFSYPLFGLDDSNRVQYIADRGPHGSFTPIRTCRAWRAALDAGHYRYVVTTPARDPWHAHGLEHSPEGAWTRSDPAARLVFRHVAYGELISVFKLNGPLTPDGCPA